jgi:hypothetical protein
MSRCGLCASNFYSQRQFVRLFAAWPHVFSRYLCRDYVSYEAMRVRQTNTELTVNLRAHDIN